MKFADLLKRKRPSILIERHLGGLGDVVCMREAVASLKEAHADHDLIMHVQRWYFDLFTDLADALVPYEDAGLPIMWPMSMALGAGHPPIIAHQCFCPCGVHENETDFRPTRNRIENFADQLGVEPRKPDLWPLLKDWGKRLAKGRRKRAVIGLQIKSMNPSKDWPLRRWQSLAKLFGEIANLGRVRVFSHQRETWKMPNVEHVCAKTCRDLIESTAECDLMIAPDSGLMHVAAALDIPTVAMFGPTDGALTCKYYPSVRVIEHRDPERTCRQPCYYNVDNNRYHCYADASDEDTPRIGDCMVGITVVEVYHAALDLLHESGRLAA